MNLDLVKPYWDRFLTSQGLPRDTNYYEAFYFGSDEKSAKELLQLVLIGKKKATSSSLWGLEKQMSKLPSVGDLSVVTDWNGAPKAVIETTAVSILPFRNITFEICKREGEDDTLESWQKNHSSFFNLEAKEIGYTFTKDMPVVFEDFILLCSE